MLISEIRDHPLDIRSRRLGRSQDVELVLVHPANFGFPMLEGGVTDGMPWQISRTVLPCCWRDQIWTICDSENLFFSSVQ